MEFDAPPPPSAGSSPAQRFAGMALALAVIGVGVWVLYDFLPALVWAGVLAIALWPVYRRLLRLLPQRCDRLLAPLLSTVGVAIIVIAPLVLLGLAVARESHFVVEFVTEARHHGL